MLAFWEKTPWPHNYPYQWFISDPKSKSHATHPLMVVIICGKYGNNRSRSENVTEQTLFSKSRSNDLEDIDQGQRSSHATHLLMLVIICTKYRKNPSRTVDATELTLFSRSRPNDLENKHNYKHKNHLDDNIGTRTTRMPGFSGYPPPPHDYPYNWVILDPKSKDDKVKITNLKNSQKF